MYDIEIAMPATLRGGYRKRLDDYKLYGLREVGSRRVLLTLLTGTDDIEGVTDGWPENVTVRVSPAAVDHCAAKVYWYYHHYDMADIEQSRWFMRLDDDSVTHVSNLMGYLDQLDSDNDAYYLMTEPVVCDVSVDVGIFRKLGILWDLKGNLRHEVEACIVSRKAFRTMMSDPLTRTIYYERSQVEDGYTDTTLAFSARRLGIVPCHVQAINRDPLAEDFIEGKTYHVHYVSHDKNPDKYEMLKTDRLRSAQSIHVRETVVEAQREAVQQRLQYLVTCCPRSGSVYMARVMGTLGVETGHEAIFSYDGIDAAIARLQRKVPIQCSVASKTFWDGKNLHNMPDWMVDESAIVADSSYMSAPYLNHEILRETQIIHLVRDPVKVVNSITNYLHYLEEPEPTNAYEEFIFQHMPVLSNSNLTPCERAALFYVEWNRMIERNTVGRDVFLFRAEDPIDPLYKFLHKAPHNWLFTDTRANTRAVPCKPFSIDELSGDLRYSFIDMGKRYGYRMTSESYGQIRRQQSRI